MALDHERRHLPQMYRRFETIWTRKINESESERMREDGWWWERKKRRKKNYLNHSLFIQPHSAFGRLVYILGVAARTHTAGWSTAHPECGGISEECRHTPVRIKESKPSRKSQTGKNERK